MNMLTVYHVSSLVIVSVGDLVTILALVKLVFRSFVLNPK